MLPESATRPLEETTAHQPAQRFCILGTAGHIDHGKSSLVKALTGTDPDRLPEEKARGMTIELGFAHMDLALPEAAAATLRVGIVDVPGHERFIRTMVAGATGIDLGMLVVAADDGVMPQTREHVEILDLLGVHTGLIVISKIDLVPGDRIAVVGSQIRELTVGTPLATWPLVPASARSGRGLDDIRSTVVRLAATATGRPIGEVFRLAIDRVFAVRGRGTVVTGSVLAGSVRAGAALELMPPGLECRVRQVQSHGSDVEVTTAGQRAALNITGIERERLERGMELATPGFLCPSRYVDATVRLLPRREKPLASHSRVRVCMGTAEHMATLVVIGGDTLEPGRQAPVQLRFFAPAVAAYGQRFIVRSENALVTLGGGQVFRPVSRRLRSGSAEEIESARRAQSDEAAVRYEEAVRGAGFEPLAPLRIACQTGLSPAEVQRYAAELEARRRLVPLTPERRVHAATLEAVEKRTLAYLLRHHQTRPAEPGVLRDRLVGWIEKRSAPGCGKAICKRVEDAGAIVARGPYLAHRDFRPAMAPEDAALYERAIAEIEAAKFDPPAFPALRALAGVSRQRAKTLEDAARCDPRLVCYAPQQFISAATFAEFKETVRRVGRGRNFKLAEIRDALHLNRRAVQPLLEYLDRTGCTRRVGDERVLLEGDR